MPKRATEMSAKQVRDMQAAISSKTGEPYTSLHPVGGVSGLLIQVTPSGGKSWLLRTMVGKKRRHIGLGGFPDVSLSRARDVAREMKEQIRQGIDPIEERQYTRRRLIAEQQSLMTFDEAARQFIESKRHEFKNASQIQQWVNSLATYATPYIGDLPVSEIDLPQIKAVLDPIWTTKTETATRVRGRVEKVLGWCAVHGYRTGENPARWRGYLDSVYPNPSKVKETHHYPALPVNRLGEFMASLSERDGMAAKALQFTILTAKRTAEVIGDNSARRKKDGTRWREIDLKRKLWVIPGERMKGDNSTPEHTVPLCDDAVAILASLPQGGPDDLVFPGPRGGIPSVLFG